MIDWPVLSTLVKRERISRCVFGTEQMDFGTRRKIWMDICTNNDNMGAFPTGNATLASQMQVHDTGLDVK